MTQKRPRMQDAELERLMAAHGTPLLRMCLIYLEDENLARDAVQETFLKAFRRWHTFRGESDELTWLTRIAINTCRDMQRTTWFRLIDRRKSLDDLPEHAYIQQFRDDTVLQAVARLPRKYREVILLYYYQGMKQQEIASALSLPLSTVKSRLSRARDRLHDDLKGWFEA